MNGCIAQAHSNLFIPSTLSGSNYDASGLNKAKLTENVNVATDVYIDRINGSPCCGTNLHLFKGGNDEEKHERSHFFEGKCQRKKKN